MTLPSPSLALAVRHEEMEEASPFLPVLPIFDDLLVEIFSRYLPVKSLLICKVVCKSWYLLISSPQFVKTHILHSSAKAKTESSLLAIYETREHGISATRFIFNRSCVSGGPSPPSSSEGLCLQVFNSFHCSTHYGNGLRLCHGLILGSTRSTTIPSRYVKAIVNLATGEIYELPLVHEHSETGFFEIVHDASSNSYKVFFVEDFCWSAYVFTLGNDGLWRKVNNFPPLDINGAADLYRHAEYNCYVFPSLHGVPYLVHNGTRKEQLRALVFDVEKESFLTIDFDLSRTGFMHLRRKMALSAYRGSLYLFDYNMEFGVVAPGNVGVWVMNNYENKVWVKEEKSFNLKSVYPKSTRLFEDGSHIFIRIRLVTVIDDGIVMKLECLADRRDYEVVYAIYDPIEKVLGRFSISDEIKALAWNVILGDQFAESLVSPRRGY